MTAIFDGSPLIARSSLRRHYRSETSAPNKAAILKALVDPDYATDLASAASAGVAASGNSAEVGTPSWLQQILAWIEANWPAILAAILALFGIPVSPPAKA